MSGERQIVIDEEMTGLDLAGGDRMVEIGCIELIDGKPTGKTFSTYVNPDGRPMSEIALSMTGLTDEFLAKQPPISKVAQDIRNFIGDSEIIVYSSSADEKFLNNEMKLAGLAPFLPRQFLNLRDWAAKMYSLGESSLCQMLDHYKIDTGNRSEESGHGALIDADLTAKLYPKLKEDWKQYNRRLQAAIRKPAP